MKKIILASSLLITGGIILSAHITSSANRYTISAAAAGGVACEAESFLQDTKDSWDWVYLVDKKTGQVWKSFEGGQFKEIKKEEK